MNFNNTYAIATIVAGGILLATTMTSNSDPRNTSDPDECCDTRISRQTDTPDRDLNSCTGDGLHKAEIARIRNTRA